MIVEQKSSRHDFEEIVGSSPLLRQVFRRVELAAPTGVSVLIVGETGTGKELIARAVHNLSRRQGHFIGVSCAALAPALIESELFGHEKGAFTNAVTSRTGRFELAHRGTLFPDEVFEAPLEVQAKLLRFLEEQEFERVGSARTIRVDVRLVSATNRNPARAVEQNRLRADLYYRLNVFPIDVPSLRERKQDIPPLVHHFVKQFSIRFGKRIEKISCATMQRLLTYRWPGNVRELRNLIERSVISSPGSSLELEDEAFSPPSANFGGKKAQGLTLEDVKRDHIVQVLEHTGWVVEGPGGAAKILGLHPSTLRSRIKKLGLAFP